MEISAALDFASDAPPMGRSGAIKRTQSAAARRAEVRQPKRTQFAGGAQKAHALRAKRSTSTDAHFPGLERD